jgi:hypothetical protein
MIGGPGLSVGEREGKGEEVAGWATTQEKGGAGPKLKLDQEFFSFSFNGFSKLNF